MTSPRWETLAESLAKLLEGYQVKHAIFTTYAFEPDFFETSIFPLLLHDRGEALSLNSAVRRLQVEQMLRDSPIPTDVYFDSKVAVPGAPWLPYSLHPVSMQGEFHGKVVLLRLEETVSRKAKWLLGAGSANLTKAGWWENIEVWHFAPVFDSGYIPSGLGAGLAVLLQFLKKSQIKFSDRRAAVSATQLMHRELAAARIKRRVPDDAKFGVFVPKGEQFPDWMSSQAPEHEGLVAEIISPYFAGDKHDSLALKACNAMGVSEVRLWLPHDSWQPGGPAVLVEKTQYEEIGKTATWCKFSEPTLAAQRDPKSVPRFLHAKVFRVPGEFCFIGSVNFSHKAFHQNFEAGFLVKDGGGPWLAPTKLKPEQFLETNKAALQEVEVDPFGVRALFDWQSLTLTVEFPKTALKQYTGYQFLILDGSGSKAAGAIVPEDGSAKFDFRPDDELCRTLQRCTWITLSIAGTSYLVWVQQEGLEYRPPPSDLTPDAWRILDLWRGLVGGRAGSHPDAFKKLEVQLAKKGEKGEDPYPVDSPDDLFSRMARAHGCFHALRETLVHLRDSGDSARLQYYFSADRPDTLRNLLDQLRGCADRPSEEDTDPVEAWVLLRWMQQLCLDHEGIPEAKQLARRVRDVILELEKTDILNAIDGDWLGWVAAMFLCAPGKEQSTANRLLKKVS